MDKFSCSGRLVAHFVSNYFTKPRAGLAGPYDWILPPKPSYQCHMPPISFFKILHGPHRVLIQLMIWGGSGSLRLTKSGRNIRSKKINVR